MNPIDLMKALHDVPEDLAAACFETEKQNDIPQQLHITANCELPVQKEFCENEESRRRTAMKQNHKGTVLRMLPWHIGIGAAVAACAIIAVSIGKDMIGRSTQMQAGASVSTAASGLTSEQEQIEIADYRAEGFDVPMNLPEHGTAMLLHTLEDAKPWLDLVRQSGEYGRETGQGGEDFRKLLENEDIYQNHDIIMTAVPYQHQYADYGVAMYHFAGASVTPSGKLTVDVNFLTVGNDMPERILQEIDTFCCCFAVPKNTVPDIWSFTFNDVIYDCTAPVPQGCDTREQHLEYLYSLQNYQAFNRTDGEKRYLRRAEDTPVLLGEQICAFSARRDREDQPDWIKVPEVPEENDVQVFRNLEEMQQAFAGTDILEGEHCMAPGINSEIFKEHDVLYLAYRKSVFSEAFAGAGLCSGALGTDGTLTLNYSELINDSPDARHISERVNYYEFYLVPKDSLPNLSKLNMQMYAFHTTVPDAVSQEYHDSIPEQIWFTWENGTEPPADCEEIGSAS